MKKRLLSAIRCILFLLLLAGLIAWLNTLFVSKYMYDKTEPQTATYKGFYQMEKDSVDLLILGTSHGASGFNPQDFYDAAHVRAYNLSSSAQPVWLSYYWLQEALKYQKPSAVIFECNYLFSTFNNEGANRKALDEMKIGKVKYDAVQTAVALSPNDNESALSYFLPYIRYHTRWKDLNEWDFTGGKTETPSALKGFWFYYSVSGYQDFVPLSDQTDSTAVAAFEEPSFSYFKKIVALCRENGIQLILVKTPDTGFTREEHNAVQAYASENDLPFYDFNMQDLYTKIGFDFSQDTNNAKNTHANLSGARKMSRFLAQEITDQGWVEPCTDPQWEQTKRFNDDSYKDFLLRHTTDIHDYLQALQDTRYTIFFSVRDDAGNNMTAEIQQDLAALGLQASWDDAYQHSYLAVVDSGKVTYEQMADEEITYASSFRNGLVRIEMTSAGHDAGDLSSIKIDNAEQSKNRSGLNIVVYNNARHCVIDSVNFDFSDSAITCQR